MRAPQLVVVEYDGWIARHLTDIATEGAWLVRGVRSVDVGRSLARELRPCVLVVQVELAEDNLAALRLIADIHRRAGRYEQALTDYQDALRMARENGDPYEEGKVLEGIAEATLATGRFDDTRIALRQALDIYERLGVPEAEKVRIRIETIVPDYVARIS